MIKMLQVSDLHIVEDAHWNNLKALLLDLAKEKFSILPEGQKLLVMTGDYHNYNETDYEKATLFIKELVCAMKIDITEDVFMIPGNHDMALATNPREKKMHDAIIQSIKTDITHLQDDDYIEMLLEPFSAYSDFCKSLVVYSEDASPERVHVRTWRDKLDLIHINTCLVADKNEKTNQLVETKAVTGLTIEGDRPCIVLGHNSYYDLHKDIQKTISAAFMRYKVKAYLCGDRHKFEKDRNEQYIRLGEGYINAPQIPNIVCGKSTADVKDVYSDFGCFIHEWDQNTNLVKLRSLVWNPEQDQGRFIEHNDGEYDLNDDALVSSKSEENHDDESSEIPQEVFENYCNYIRTQCSEIELNGLPIDDEENKRRFELSSIYMPSRLCLARENLRYYELLKVFHCHHGKHEIYNQTMIPQKGVFQYLILAGPGAGKTTLLKAISSFYCLPELYGDKYNFTKRDLFPIWIRCRDLKGDDLSIWTAIKNIERLGEWKPSSDRKSKGIVDLVNYHINNETALLLIDGLDEIGSDAGRKSFVNQLKQFIENNKSVNVIITSREKGFSIISDNSFNSFIRFRIDSLDDKEIEDLCIKWYTLVYGDKSSVREEGRRLAVDKIIANKRIKILAQNPLMLMTLLLVDRRIGNLPTKRAGLYYEATRVLLETWNSNYHNEITIDLEEAKNQLAYVAFQMTVNYEKYKNRVTKTELRNILIRVREECSNHVPGTDSIDNVLKVVERRSGLLIQTGTGIMADGHSEPIYEFQHLTFQEYLAAYAVSIGCYPGSSKAEYKCSVLVPFLYDSNMKEVILLAAAINAECAEKLCDIMLKKLEDNHINMLHYQDIRYMLLQFIADEVSLSRDRIRNIISISFNMLMHHEEYVVIRRIASGKYKKNMESFMQEKDDEQNDKAGFWTTFLDILTERIDNPYRFFKENNNSEDPILRLRSLFVLNHAHNLDSVDKINNYKLDLLLLSEENNVDIAKNAFRCLSETRLTYSEMIRYFASTVTFINRFQKLPQIVSFDKLYTIDNKPDKQIFNISEKRVTIAKESIDMICAHMKMNYLKVNPIDYGYIGNKLTLMYIVSMYCDEYETIDRLYTYLVDLVVSPYLTLDKKELLDRYLRIISTDEDIPQITIRTAIKHLYPIVAPK